MKKHLFLTFVAFFSYCIGILAQSGTCGDNLTWSIQDGTLTISGTGEMEDYSESNVPWYNYRDGINNIVINNGVTSIGDNAFRKCSALTSIEIPLGVTNIGFYSFSGCSSLKTITIPQSTKYIRTQAFLGCTALEQVICYNPNFSAFYFEDAFEEINENCVLMVPKNSIEAYADWAQYFGGGIKALEEESTEPFVDGIYYTFNEDGTSVSVTYGPDGEDTYSGNVSVPASVSILGKTYSVTGIGENAFKGCSSLTSVTLPEGLKTIGIRGFDVCTSLESINFPSTLTSIGDYAFALCNSLKTIELPEGLTSLPLGVFKDCENITSVTLPSTFKSIGIETFQNCKNLETINLPSGLTSIGESAFSGCAKLSSVEFPQNLNELGGNSISGCTSLKSVSIPLGVKDIWTDTFASCSSLETVTFAEGLELIGNNAFLRCSALKSVSIPSTVKELGYNAFAQCSALSEITFANGLETIGYRAFLQCSALKEITLPETVNEVKEAAFSQCYGLENVTLPEGLSKMGTYVFNSCPGLKNINIPSSLKQLPEGTFHDCYALQSVTIPEETETIAVNLLTNCQALQKVVIPAGVKTIQGSAFRGCINLTEIICLPATPPTLHDEVFGGINSAAILTVINAEAYADWAEYFVGGIKEMKGTIGEGLTWSIQDGTLTISGTGEMIFSDDFDYGHSNREWYEYRNEISKIVIEEGVTQINDYAFWGMDKVVSVSLPTTLTSLGTFAFRDCSELIEINLPAGLKHHGQQAFLGCDKLLEEHNGLYYVGNWVVNPSHWDGEYSSESFRSNTIGISGDALPGLKIQDLILPNGLKYIGTHAFGGSSMQSLTIPASVVSIGERAFLNCSELLDVYCHAEKVPDTGSSAFEGPYIEYATLHVPAASIENYKTTTPWSEFGKIAALPVEKTLLDGEVYENGEDEECNNITYTRTLSKTNTWNALYVPFEIPVTAEFLEDYDVAYFNDIHSFDEYIGDKENGVKGKDGVIDRMDMEVLMVQEGATLNANYPYLIRAKKEDALNMNIKVENATLYKAVETTVSCSSVFMKFDVTGIYTTKTSGELKGEFNVYAMSGGGWKQAFNDTQQLKPFRLYLSLTSIDGSPVKVAESAMKHIRIRVDGEEEATGIDEIQTSVDNSAVIYDLQGCRVKKAGKGIYIVNGKKVVMK